MKTLTRIGRLAACVALLNFAVPGTALLTFGTPVKDKVDETLTQRATRLKDISNRRAKNASRLLTSKEERGLQGKTLENPYMAGQAKWDVVYKGVNLLTGNFSTSASDMSFSGGYGIPVNVTRSYSANNADEGPFGKGWTLSADTRSTAGGIAKSGSSPSLGVPTVMKERASFEDDPNLAVEPAAAVIAVDAGGQEETIQKDVDGILTTPPWDKNTYDSVYEWVTLNGIRYQVLLSNVVKTADGTVYAYAKKGSYPNGTVPWDNASATPEAANILKVTSATDRQGNITTYSYGTSFLTFQKANGITSENPLTMVTMPGGHVISFTWGVNSSLASYNRITAASDGLGGRSVTYGYTGTPGHGLLTSVTSPGGKTTSYEYGDSLHAENAAASGVVQGVATQILTAIVTPNGLRTTIKSSYQTIAHKPWNNNHNSLIAYEIDGPNGVRTYYQGCYVDFNVPNYDIIGWYHGYCETAGQFLPNQSNVLAVKFLNTFYDTTAGTVGVDILDATNDSDDFQEPRNKADDISRVYSMQTQDLIEENRTTGYWASGSSDPAASFNHYSGEATTSRWPGAGIVWAAKSRVQQITSFNFLGNPLSNTTKTYTGTTSSSAANTLQQNATVSYAYWGPEKYYQQKAVKDQAGRITYTDYYPNTSAAGKRGQTYRVYDPKNTAYTYDPITPPAGTPSGNVWKYQVRPTSATSYAATFDYDTQGRVTDSWRLQKTTTSPWTYAQTHVTYGSGGSPSWGQASSVVEDYGGINRTTDILEYTSWGKATKTRDAAGRIFETAFDGDGRVQSITRTDVTPNVPILTYTYGGSPGSATFGQVTSVTDGLSGVSQAFGYVSSGSGIGQLASITETNGTDSYSTSFTYNSAGDREKSTLVTPNGTSRWGYFDYVSLGDPTALRRAYQTMIRLDASGNPTPEEFHYRYDTSGRLIDAAFAQTPATSFTPTGTNRWYDPTHPASRRARAHYVYDPLGRVTSLEHYWDTWNSSASNYSSEAILANQCDYEISGSYNRGLKTASRFYVKNTASPANFALERTETYGYDSALDYLTSANYGDGLANATPTWSYDAAGNRNDTTVVDNLNRATTIGGAAVTNDILGNRLTKSGVNYNWDALNRLTSLSGNVTASYQYRSDGIRVTKTTGGVTTRYRHDGQMGVEDVEIPGTGSATVTRYGLGARGLDFMERTTGSTVATVFPLYDAHGSMVGNVSRSGSTYSLNDRRSYDAWGVVRSGAATGDPKNRYVGNLGHKQDDETGLIYMRARYYEPTTSRFICEDSSRKGRNWFAYASDNPVKFIDKDGKDSTPGEDLLKGLDDAAEFLKKCQELINTAQERTQSVYKLIEDIWDQTDGSVVEAAWGEFMKQFKDGMEKESDLRDKLKEAVDGSVSGTLMEGAGIGVDMATLALGYQVRLLWYLKDC